MENTNNDMLAQDYLEKFTEAFSTMFSEAISRNKTDEGEGGSFSYDPQKILDLVSNSPKIDTSRLIDGQISLMEQQVKLWQSSAKALLGEKVDPVITEARGDKRFGAADWNNHPLFSYMKQSYLLNSKMLETMVDSIEFDDNKTAEKAKFYARQYINSVSPSNSALTNPEVLQEIIDTKGENLVKGMDNLIHDLKQSPIEGLKISQAEQDAFEVGGNLAVTPGKVIYQNDLMQLIQYEPVTKKVYARPMLFVPPFFNKFYILDMTHSSSMVRWMVSQGYTVFIISWVNPDASLAHKKFEDYLLEGPITALDVIQKVTGCDKINATGFCIGGTLVSSAQAYLLAKGDERINSLTLLTTLLDFSEPGELGNFIFDQVIPLVEQGTNSKGVFDGRVMGLAFSMLRENNLFWSYFVNNYLKGKKPAPFDILYWNSDGTNIPATAFNYYLRNTYVENNLMKPGHVVLDGVPIDLSIIKTPTFYLATESDHIVLWESAYASAKLFSGPKTFVLSGSGHLAGVINSPDAGKYPHWLNDDLPETAAEWKAGAVEEAGSWWLNWDKWLKTKSGKKVEARIPGSVEGFESIEDAPGSYVKVRI